MIFEKQVLAAFKEKMYTRCDGDGLAFYFSAEDFPALISEEYSFSSSLGHVLKGYLYHYENPISHRLIVFDHGFGAGHRAYMKEIELLCRAGFLVLSYDHTGCMESGGDSPRGFSQSLYDLDDCIKAVKGDARFDGYDISVIGHSWGGFSTLNISAIHKEISHVVVLSGFVSVSAIVGSFFAGLLRGYRKPVMALEAATNPYYANFDGVSSIKKSAVKALLIYSDNDTLCSVSHYNTLKAGLCENENVTLRLEAGKGHNPNYTVGAVKYLGEYFKAKKKFLKSKKVLTESEKAAFVKSFDWNKMTEQDGDVWEQILAFLCDKTHDL